MAKKKKEDDKKVTGTEPEETEEKSGGALSEGVLEAFDDATPTGLEEEDVAGEVEEEDDELGDLDFRTSDDW